MGKIFVNHVFDKGLVSGTQKNSENSATRATTATTTTG